METLDYYLYGKGRQNCAYCAYFLYFMAFIGFVNIFQVVKGIVLFLNRHLLRSQENLLKRYGGRDSWAVVTGGSDGIGEQYCRDLAQQGFNICIVGRNEQKMKVKLEDIKARSGRPIKTRYLVCDFARHTKLAPYEKLAEQMRDMDIAVLVLNAGVAQMAPFKDIPVSYLEETVNVNVLHPGFMTRTLLHQMLKREQRSAIIYVSSIVAAIPAPGHSLYAATKSFVSYLGMGLNYELRDKVDVLAF
jgi:17beta-estradiol 17-dehydrogenase / very-long-chain 3-oxoacyl-CoA reductase